MNIYSSIAATLSSEFHKFLIDHERQAKVADSNALIIFRVEGDDDFIPNQLRFPKNRRRQHTALVPSWVLTESTSSLLRTPMGINKTDYSQYNEWHEATSLKSKGKKQAVIYVTVKSWREHSAFEKVNIIKAAA